MPRQRKRLQDIPDRDRRPYRVGELVVAAGTHPYHEEHRLKGLVGIVMFVKRPPKGWDDYIRDWGNLQYADVLIGGELWSMGPEDLRHAEPA